MSTSPSTSTEHFDQPSGKRRRTTSFSLSNAYPASDNRDMVPAGQQAAPMGHPQPPPPPVHIPKRGARACTNCRKGKNRCEGEVSVFAKFPSILVASTVPLHDGPPPPPGPAYSSIYRLLVVVAN
ncbi:hypothetical protein NLI96_g10324 [Meripilus lineatus]|uniref:Zn(2)-C6 fungal-type domain-containing protein n=1 Tax=Meripilus lineatus TaxID=2056292 RepID=A0AAD5UU54_9APHY|nr:hypothetical protein NLI96_g10324 [Physisporinus lineatus]